MESIELLIRQIVRDELQKALGSKTVMQTQTYTKRPKAVSVFDMDTSTDTYPEYLSTKAKEEEKKQTPLSCPSFEKLQKAESKPFSFGVGYIDPNFIPDDVKQEEEALQKELEEIEAQDKIDMDKLPFSNGSVTPSKSEPKKRTRKPFVPPTLEEVKSYIAEKGYAVNAEQFMAYYESKNWHYGINNIPVKNWKTCVVTWAYNKNSYQAPPSNAISKVDRMSDRERKNYYSESTEYKGL